MKYRKKPVVIEASRWWRNGDHPWDASCDVMQNGKPLGFLSEGKIVRYYRHPNVDGKTTCRCGRTMHEHGWIDTLEGGHIVCPGDFIITGVKGEHYPCKPDIFVLTYESEDDPPQTANFVQVHDKGCALNTLVDLHQVQVQPSCDCSLSRPPQGVTTVYPEPLTGETKLTDEQFFAVSGAIDGLENRKSLRCKERAKRLREAFSPVFDSAPPPEVTK